ncbi:MAG: hypothetical protein ACRC5H_08700, partial [Treponemataceae bacterium]
QKVFINDTGLEIPLYVGFSISLFDSYKVKKSSREKTAGNILFAGGRFYYGSENSETAWFSKKKPFSSAGNHYFLGEFDFTSPLFSLFSTFSVSENTFTKISFFTRNELSIRLDFFRFHTKIFYGSDHFMSSEAKLLKYPLELYINPQLVFHFNTKIPFTMQVAAAAQIENNLFRTINLQEKNNIDIKSGLAFNTKTFFLSGDFGILSARYDKAIFFEKESDFYFLGEFSWKPKWKKNQQEFSISARYDKPLQQTNDKQKVTIKNKLMYRPIRLLKTELNTSFVIEEQSIDIFSIQAKTFFSLKKDFFNTLLNAKFICEKTSKRSDIKINWGLGATLEFDFRKFATVAKKKS